MFSFGEIKLEKWEEIWSEQRTFLLLYRNHISNGALNIGSIYMYEENGIKIGNFMRP